MFLLILVTLVVFCLSACNQAPSPSSPGLMPDAPISESGSPVEYDPIDELFREGAGVIDGDVTLNGSTETDPNYDTSPYIVTQPAKAGDIAIFRVKGKLTNSATTTLYTKQSSPSKNYSSFSVPGNFTDQYKAMYVTGTEPLSITFYNANNYNAPINSKAVIYDYNFKTQAAQNAGEPNDDENALTITDRASANNINIGTTATRSVFFFDAENKDTEEWYKTTVSAGENFSFKFTTVRDRFGTWGFTMKVFDPDGVQMGDTTTISVGEGAASISRTALSTGTYYLQLVGTPVTKNNTNLYYNLYTITPCVKPRITGVNSQSNIANCPGETITYSVVNQNGATSYFWQFGGGATPNSSTDAVPTLTLGEAGNYDASVTVYNSCGFDVFDFNLRVECVGNVGRMGGGGAFVTPVDVEVLPNGTTYLLGSWTGTADLDPGLATANTPASASTMFLSRLATTGDLSQLMLLGGSAGTSITPNSLDYTDEWERLLVAGQYSGIVDMRPGVLTRLKNSAVDGENFALRLPLTLTDYESVVTWGTNVLPIEGEFDPGDGTTMVGGTYTGTVDFDPGFSTFSRTSNGGQDAYLARYDSAGRFINAVTWGGAGDDICRAVAVGESLIYVGGSFTNTVDFDPGPGTITRTCTGTSAGFLLGLDNEPMPTYYRANAYTGAGSAVLVTDIRESLIELPLLCGNFSGIASFDATGTSNGGTDAFLLSLNSSWGTFWLRTWGGTGNDTATALVIAPGTDNPTVIGDWRNTVDFNPGAGIDNRAAVSNADSYMLQVDEEGIYRFASTWGGLGIESPKAIGVDVTGVFRVLGTFGSQQADFDPGPDVFNMTGLGIGDAYFQRFLPNGLWTE